MPNKLFSIIIPTLNAGRKLEETINSVLAQDDELFELLIIDGGSTDETLDIVRQYPNQIVLFTGEDSGIYDAMNKGIERAGGEYLHFLGAGDCLRLNILKTISKTISQEGLSFIYGSVYLKEEKREYGGEFDEARITRRNICHQAIFYSRRIFELLGNYDLRYKLLADHAFNLKCFGDERVKKIYVDAIIADYEGSGASKLKDLNFIEDAPRLIRENFGLKRYLLNRLKNAQDKLFHADSS